MSKSYVGDVGTEIVLDCGSDISAASALAIAVLKPDGSEVSWPAEIKPGEPNKLRYITQEGALDQPGDYMLQAAVTVAGWSGRGESGLWPIYDRFK